MITLLDAVENQKPQFPPLRIQILRFFPFLPAFYYWDHSTIAKSVMTLSYLLWTEVYVAAT